jgi:uncharacterized protein YkwD
VERSIRILTPFVLLAAPLTLACTSTSPAANAGSGEEAASTGADQVIVTTLVPLPTRTREPATPTQQPAATLAAPTSTLTPRAATHTPQPTQVPTVTPSPTATARLEAATATPAVTSSPTPSSILTGSAALSSREQAIFDAHNAERSSRGIPPLSIDPTLHTIARSRAQIMADNNLFSHYAPNGDTIYDMFDDAGYDWDDATENIHFNDVPLSQAEAWAMNEYMASAPHRASILKSGFHRVGIGVATSASGVHYYSVVLSD